ncbi:MAG: triacylglycerol lipase [Deltaproteobacteria bacterium]|nr:triacylglycerol lipase [Deltaproteobacteria bacterium]
MAQHHFFLVPGFFGFVNLGNMVYFAHVREYLRDRLLAAGLDVEIHRVATPPTASLRDRARRLLEEISSTAPDDGSIHLIGHSSGALDARLLASPRATLGRAAGLDEVRSRIRSVVSVGGPHHGTPLASFFQSVFGGVMLQMLSASTVVVLRYGHLPLGAALKLTAVIARGDDQAVDRTVIDQLLGDLFADFSPERRTELSRLFGEVARDRSLIPELAPEAMTVFNAACPDAEGVRYGAVISRARPPTLTGQLTQGLDPFAQFSAGVYQLLYRLNTRMPAQYVPDPTPEQETALRAVYGDLPGPDSNDGIVPTRSQLWGDVVHVTRADHLDTIGHFDQPDHLPPHYDWIATGTGFNRHAFEDLWHDVAQWLLRGVGA